MAVFEEKTCEKMNKISACVILLIVVLSCSDPVNNRQLKTTESLTQNIASSDTIKDVLNENTVKDFSTVALGMKYRTKKEWNDFTEPDREEYIITSKGLGKLFGIQIVYLQIMMELYCRKKTLWFYVIIYLQINMNIPIG